MLDAYAKLQRDNYVLYTIPIMLDDIEPPEISQELLDYIATIKSKRARVVLEHILQHGYITTKELQETYGYEHPPRAAKDVRDNGIQLKTVQRVIDGKRMAVYMLSEEGTIDTNRQGGRRVFTKELKNQLLARDGEQCMLCKRHFPGNMLQIDHRVPYEVAGDRPGVQNPIDFMLLCASCNRAKSWSCEHCTNWQTLKRIDTCQMCMFGSPDNYLHIAMQQRRSLTVSWDGTEVAIYESLKNEAEALNQSVERYVKDLLRIHVIHRRQGKSK